MTRTYDMYSLSEWHAVIFLLRILEKGSCIQLAYLGHRTLYNCRYVRYLSYVSFLVCKQNESTGYLLQHQNMLILKRSGKIQDNVKINVHQVACKHSSRCFFARRGSSQLLFYACFLKLTYKVFSVSQRAYAVKMWCQIIPRGLYQ
jgi:hypothetical protein